MNCPPSEAKLLSFWEYDAMLYNWNAQRDDNPPSVDPKITEQLLARAAVDPRMTGPRNDGAKTQVVSKPPA